MNDEIEKTANTVALLLARLTHRIEVIRKSVFAGLCVWEFDVLAAIARGHHASLGELAAELGLDRSALAKRIAVLESSRVLEVRRPNSRRLVLTLTPMGVAFVRMGLPEWERAEARALEEIGERFEDLRRLLDRRDRQSTSPAGPVGKLPITSPAGPVGKLPITSPAGPVGKLPNTSPAGPPEENSHDVP